MRNNTLKCR